MPSFKKGIFLHAMVSTQHTFRSTEIGMAQLFYRPILKKNKFLIFSSSPVSRKIDLVSFILFEKSSERRIQDISFLPHFFYFLFIVLRKRFRETTWDSQTIYTSRANKTSFSKSAAWKDYFSTLLIKQTCYPYMSKSRNQ